MKVLLTVVILAVAVVAIRVLAAVRKQEEDKKYGIF